LKRANLRRKWSTIRKQGYFTISRHASPRGGFLFYAQGSLKTPACRWFSITLQASS